MKKLIFRSSLLILFILAFAYKGFSQTFDYVISIQGSVVTATPHNVLSYSSYSGSDAYTVIQSAINALTPAGSGGSGGGSIKFATGNFFLSNELTINGWEGNINPTSQIILEGSGWATKIVQQTTGKNAFVVKNAANFKLANMMIYTGANSKSCLLADDSGTNEMSCFKSVIDNILFQSNSTAYPALYLKNFFDLSAPSIHAENTSNHAIVLENTSATTNYGNSHFGFVRTVASTASPYAGLVIRSTNVAKFTNLLTFSNYECVNAYYGVYSDNLKYSVFNFVDIEYIARPIFLTGSASGNETRGVTFNGGYVSSSDGNTAITNTLYTGGNKFNNIFIDGNATAIPISDQSQYRPANSYDVIFGYNTNPANVSIASPATTELKIVKGDGTVSFALPGVTSVATAAAGTNTTQIASTAFVTSAVNAKANVASPTFTGNPVLPTISLTSTSYLINGTTSGTMKCIQPFIGSSYKKVVIYCNALKGSATFSYPTAFSYIPAIVTAGNGPAASVVTSLSATSVTITGATTSGYIILEGY